MRPPAIGSPAKRAWPRGSSIRSICQVFDLGNADGRPYIAMELVEGESLADRLARGPMPPGDALRTAANARRPGGPARPWHRASRSQAVERLPHHHRPEAARLRTRPAGDAGGRHRPPAHRGRNVRGHAAVHLARAARGRPGRRTHRSVLGGGRGLRDALRPAAVLGRDPAGARPCRDVRGAARPHRRGGGRRRRPHAASRPGQGAGGSLSHGAAVCRRSAGGAGARRERTDGGGAADPAAGRAAVPAAQAGCRDRLPRSQPRRCPGQFTVRARVAGRAIDAQVGALCPGAARSGPAGHRPGRGRRAGRDAAGIERPRARQRRAGRRAGR